MREKSKFLLPVAGVTLFLVTLFYLLRTLPNKNIPVELRSMDMKITQLTDSDKQPERLRPLNRFPDVNFRVRVTRNETEVVYDHIHEVDQNLMRKNPSEMKSHKKHALFVGCSVAWGIGLLTHDTLPYQYQNLRSDVRALNLGFPGGGIQHALYYSDLFDLKKILSPSQGHLIYIFIPDHIDRFSASYQYLSWASPWAPHYEIDNDKFIYSPVSELTSFKFIRGLRKAGLHKAFLNFQGKYHFTTEKMENFIKALTLFKTRYEAHNRSFIFVIHPMANMGEASEILKNLLNQNQIQVLDPVKDFNQMMKESGKSVKDFIIPGEGHPNKEMNQWLAAWLVRNIQ